MSDFNLTRKRVVSLIATLWVIGIAASLFAWTFWLGPREPTVEVEHWATGHLMREGEKIRLLPVMAEEFNPPGLPGYAKSSGVPLPVVEQRPYDDGWQDQYHGNRLASSGVDRFQTHDGACQQSFSPPDHIALSIRWGNLGPV